MPAGKLLPALGMILCEASGAPDDKSQTCAILQVKNARLLRSHRRAAGHTSLLVAGGQRTPESCLRRESCRDFPDGMPCPEGVSLRQGTIAGTRCAFLFGISQLLRPRRRWQRMEFPPRAAEVSVEIQGKATRITLLDFKSPQMRAFHMAWIAFFLCFFAWFGIAPLMAVVREELELTKDQIGWCIIASVAITILARLWIGWLCERYGPRLTYTWLLILGSLPVMLVGLSW